MELLAPAGSFEALIAAVQNGADAVYAGGHAFNARENADNFDAASLQKAVDYCHVRGVRLYMALNTLLHGSELDEALRLVDEAQQCGVDALIVQDVGFAAMVREAYASMPMHASTQMGIHTLEGVRALERYGFERAILSRETPMEDIAAMRGKTSLDIECFVHGALCVSFSGQCLFSSLTGNRSGNRGRCAQPCRLPYRMHTDGEAGNKGYFLSMKDLCTLEHLARWQESGVASLKIEGRLKRSEYVAVVTRQYRAALDALQEGRPLEETAERLLELKKIFHRGGFTAGLSLAPEEDHMARERPNHEGISVGRIERVTGKSRRCVVSVCAPLRVGDGVECRGKRGAYGGLIDCIERAGVRREAAEAGEQVEIALPCGVAAGDILCKTSDAVQLEEARQSIEGEHRMVALAARVVLCVGAPPVMRVTDEKGVSASVAGEEIVQRAERRALTREDVDKQMRRLGGTPFAWQTLDIEMEEGLYLPLSALNALRRRALEAYEREKCSAMRRYGVMRRESATTQKPAPDGRVPGKPEIVVQTARLAGIEKCLDGVAMLEWVPNRHEARWKEHLHAIRRSFPHVRLCLSLPPVLFAPGMRLAKEWLQGAEACFDAVRIASLGQEQLVEGTLLAVYGDYTLNALHERTAAEWIKNGVVRLTPSVEASMAEIRQMAQGGVACEALVYGRIPFMQISACLHGQCRGEAHCPTALVDRRGYVLPVRVIGVDRCLTQVLNPSVLCLHQEMKKYGASLHAWRILLDRETPREAAAVVALFCRLRDGEMETEEDRETILALQQKGMTHGHSASGVQ